MIGPALKPPSLQYPAMLRLPWRKRVTIIAGFQCTDGILMCSDTEEYLSEESKAQVRKVPFFQFPNFTVAIGGAGDGALVDYVIQDLVKRLSRTGLDWETAEQWLSDYAQETFNRHIRPYRGLPPAFVPEVSFLIALAMGGQTKLFRWERNFLYAVPPMVHTSIGVGMLQSQQLLSEIQFYVPARRMLFFSVRMMQQVKRLVQGCGGKTEVMFLDAQENTVMQWGVFQIDKIEHLVTLVDQFLIDHVLMFIANPYDLDKGSIRKEALNQKRAVIAFRREYQKLAPELVRWFRPPPIQRPEVSG